MHENITNGKTWKNNESFLECRAENAERLREIYLLVGKHNNLWLGSISVSYNQKILNLSYSESREVGSQRQS